MLDCAVRPAFKRALDRSLFVFAQDLEVSFRTKERSAWHVGTTIVHAESGQDRSRPALLLLQDCLFPLENRSHLAHERKTSKYASLARTCEENGFTTHFFALVLSLEVGCLGFCPHGFLTCLEALGLPKS